jgi:cation diffusion facilitator CzcD-associated flavoprotein CzcO
VLVLQTELLIVGAGPFGLAMAAEAQTLGIDHLVLGEPMSFWRKHMPVGTVLRSACDWHLDPSDRDTLESFLKTRGQTPADVEPLSLAVYLDYAHWFQARKGIVCRNAQVVRLDQCEGGFRAQLGDGDELRAEQVLLALGYANFAHVPPELAAMIPAARRSHSCDCYQPGRFAGLRVLVVGGRQSAFETSVLLAEAGAAEVHICHRHDTPAFTRSDWSWVNPMLERMAEQPGWLRELPPEERDRLNSRFRAEGRLKLESWLAPRLQHPAIHIRPDTSIEQAEESASALQVLLSTGVQLEVDHVLFATGYKVDLQRVPLLAAGDLLNRIQTRDGFPVLDTLLQTSVPGLYMTSLPAARDFGLFFAFTCSVRTSAQIIGRALQQDRAA